MKKIALMLLSAVTTASITTAVVAHDGHGLAGTHWHATDALGFAVAATLVAMAFYFGKK